MLKIRDDDVAELKQRRSHPLFCQVRFSGLLMSTPYKETNPILEYAFALLVVIWDVEHRECTKNVYLFLTESFLVKYFGLILPKIFKFCVSILIILPDLSLVQN